MNFRRLYTMNNSTKIKKCLSDSINYTINNIREFLSNPNTDFTRNRKLTLETIFEFILTLEAGSLKDELYKYFGINEDVPTTSAFVQQRSKINSKAFKLLFDKFNDMTHQDNFYKGYKLLAIDGTVAPISYEPKDTKTLTDCASSHKGFNAFHINALYDLLEHCYQDVIIDNRAQMNENDALYKFADNYKGKQAIFIADRGYESYNSFEHISRGGNKYLVRIKDINSNGIARNIDYDGEFDIDIHRILSKKQTNELKQNSEYRVIPNSSRFDYVDSDHPTHEIDIRIVRFKISDSSYECIATNLERDKFDSNEIKKLYGMRWDIETSFRELKYTLDLNTFHAKKRDLIKQEIYARMTLYNFCERIVRKIKVKKTDKNKHKYQVNFTVAFHIIREFIKIKGGKNPPNIEIIISKEILPIRPGRSDPRKVKPKSVVSFQYRYN